MDLTFDDLTFLIALLSWYVVIEAKLGPRPWSWVVFSDVHQHFPCIFSKLDRSWTQTFVNHMAWSSIVGFLTLFKHWMSNLGCKPWFPFLKMFVDLMNALCCYRQTLLWLKVLTNYLNDNLLCIVNIIPILDWLVLFAHSSRGGKLMTTSPSYLKGQRVTFEI